MGAAWPALVLCWWLTGPPRRCVACVSCHLKSANLTHLATPHTTATDQLQHPPPQSPNSQYDEYIANVDIRTEYVDDSSNHQRVVYKFRPYVFEGIDAIEIKNATLMPQRVVDEIVRSCLPESAHRVEIGLMDKVRERIEKWYQDRGLPFCYVGYFDGMEEGVLRANVIEARVNDVAVRYERAGGGGDDSEGVEVYSQGDVVPAERIIAAAGFKKGEHYHIDDGQDAINNIYACGERVLKGGR